MRTVLALIALFAASACDDPKPSAPRDPGPVAEPEPQPETAPDPQPTVEPDPQPSAEPEPRPPCMDDAGCVAALGPHGRCVGTRDGLPDMQTPANNSCVIAPRGLLTRFPTPEFTRPADHLDNLNRTLADTWRAQGLQLVLRLDDHLKWQLLPLGGWLPEFRGVLYPSWDGARVAPGVEPIPLATRPKQCDGADACADLIFIDSISSPMRLPAETEDACMLSPFAFFGSARMQLLVDADGDVVAAELGFTLTLSESVARATPWGEGTVHDLFDSIDFAATVDSNGDAVPDSWLLSFATRAEADAITTDAGPAEGDCLP